MALVCAATLLLSLAAGTDPPLFLDVAEQTGILFRHQSGARGEYYLPEIMGPGAALFDYDSDGDLDVYLLQGGAFAGSDTTDRPGNRLYRNDSKRGDAKSLRFVEVGGEAGVAHPGYGMGVAVGDIDHDGHPDLYVTNFGPNVLYRNNGDGTFSDVTEASGTAENRWSTSASFCDYDSDGDHDLIVLNYIDFTLAGNKRCYDAVGGADYCNPKEYRPLPDRLFRNLGDGRFEDVTVSSGLGSVAGPGLGVGCRDLNGDQRPDIYVANDGSANFLWVNQGDGTFLEDGLMAGAAFNAEGAPEGSMGLAVGDFDNDNDDDLFMTHLTQETNTLYLNDGKGLFHDQTITSGLGVPSVAYTGFGADWIDYDNDGFLDLFVANGAVRNLNPLKGGGNPYRQINQLFRNIGGKRFTETTSQAGPVFQLSEVSRGAAIGDIDNDGDLDILLTNNDGPARLLLNQTASGHHWLSIDLDGGPQNPLALGARVEVQAQNKVPVRRVSKTDGSYLSAGDRRVHFGLGKAAGIERLVVVWPDGARESWGAQKADRIVRLRRGSGGVAP